MESALDVIKHEYAHHMDHMIYGHGGHGSTWKLCCGIVGASPIRCYNESRADYYRQKHLEESKYRSAMTHIKSVTKLPIHNMVWELLKKSLG